MEFSTDQGIATAFLVFFGLGLIGAGITALGLLFPRFWRRAVVYWSATALALFLTAVFTADSVLLASTKAKGDQALLLQLGIMSAGGLLVIALTNISRAFARSSRWSCLPTLVTTLAVAVWLGWRMECAFLTPPDWNPTIVGWKWEPVRDARITTDTGTVIPIFTSTRQVFEFTPDGEVCSLPPARQMQQLPYVNRILEREAVNGMYNCHGWTFTGGRYLLFPEAVELILRENGYQAITTPRASDLIIYRDCYGRIDHSGVVYSATPDGLILIESKWGWVGRYLHEPNVHIYGTTIQYYRSDRPTHLLRGLPDNHPPLIPSNNKTVVEIDRKGEERVEKAPSGLKTARPMRPRRMM